MSFLSLRFGQYAARHLNLVVQKLDDLKERSTDSSAPRGEDQSPLSGGIPSRNEIHRLEAVTEAFDQTLDILADTSLARRVADSERLRSQGQFKALVENSSLGIYVHRRFNPLFANSALLNMISLPDEKAFLALEDTKSFLHPTETERVEAYHDARLAGREAPVEYIMQLAPFNGSNCWVINRSFLIDWEGGLAVCTTFVDVTTLVATENALRKAKTEAEAANRAKSEMLANMSHELRTPLNAIIGFSEAIRHGIFGPINDRYLEYVDDIRSSGSHLLALINDILDLSAIEAGRLELYREEADLHPILQDSVLLVRQRARDGNVALTVDLPDRIPLLTCDTRRLKQALVNLLSNAIKFTNPGGAVSLSVEVADDDSLSLIVRDTGIGMDKDDLVKAMEFFGRAEGPLASRYEGTGLGLPLTKKLIEAQGGTLALQSEQGKGTEARITLPIN
ncbi:MAG: ATP-binding protein [Magnetovibrionaceae bacterium]